MNTITKSDFLTMVKLNHLEVLTQDQVTENCKLVQSYIRKSLVNELDEIEKADSNTIITELGFLEKWEVMRDDFSKSIVYTRRAQIDWEEPEYGELGELVKAKGGVYKDTHENKKLGRVGQKYGGSKGGEEKSDEVKKHPYGNNTSPEYNNVVRVMNQLDRQKPMFIDRLKDGFRVKINPEKAEETLKAAQKAVPGTTLFKNQYLKIPFSNDESPINYNKYK